MFQFFSQIRSVFSEMPLSRKIATGAVAFLVFALFGGIIIWSNMVEYRPLYTGLSQEDAAQVVSRLKDLKVPYKIENGGSGISVPLDKVHEVRLSMAADGVLKGGGVGFEIFNKSEFGTTEFVQKLNFQRALQGELARTIREIEEVKDARVLIVLPKDSVFVEETKPPSASVLLKLRRSLPPSRVNAIVNLVASAVEDLSPDRVTVVDSKGKILSSGTPEDPDKQLMNSQLSYKLAYEKSVAERIQSMLERIVGQGKCIVRVTADMDFSRIDVSEELYDPDGQVVRSRQVANEKSDKQNTPRPISSVNPLPADDPGNRTESKERNDDTVNYEISRTTRRTTRPLGEVQRLSVAAVLDGSYRIITAENGSRSREYVPRTAEEMKLFSTIVRQAMGYSADREDQVSVENIPFTPDEGWELEQAPATGVERLIEDYGRAAINLLIVLLVFFFVVRPLIKALKETKEGAEEPLLDEDNDGVTVEIGADALAGVGGMRDGTPQERAMRLVREDVDKAANIIKGWLGEE